MSPEKLNKYLLPFFTFAIVSRSIEEISYFYYTVPMLCVVFIVLTFKNSKFNNTNNQVGINQQDSKQPANQTGRTGMPDSEQVGMTENSESSFWHGPESDGIKDSDSQHTSFAGITDGREMSYRQIHHRRTDSESERRSDYLSASLKRIRSLFLFLIPGIWFLITSLWSSYPIISAERALYFILLSTGCFTAGILWNRFNEKNIFGFLLPVNVFVVLICLFSMITNIPSDSWTGGNGKGFMGFFGQQNELASIILFTLPSVFGMRIKGKIIKYKIAFVLLLSLNFILLLLTYSRASILSLVIGTIIFLLLNKNWKVVSYCFGALVIIAMLILLIPPIKNFSDNIIKKDFPEFYSSRIWMWEPSYRAALNGGFLGLGYGISDPNIKPGSLGDHYEGDRFVREKGNSILAVVEESGVIGLFLFLLPIFYLLVKLKMKNEKLKTDSDNSKLLIINYTLLAAITSFLVHAQFEAWWVGVGSVQLPLFFIFIGLLTGYQQVKFE